jgi:hypothetical protein
MKPDKIKTAYGLFISVDGDSETAIVKALMGDAEKKVEVAVKFLGVTKEYTLIDFFTRLGFYD